AVSATDIWAVGYSGPSGGQLSLAMHWDGTAWTVVSTPNAGPGQNPLNSLTVVAANDVWAVGENDPPGGGLTTTMIEHWNGAQWQLVASTGPGTFMGVAAVSANDIWAVGYVGNFGSYTTLAAHWNGSGWSVVATPNAGTGNNWLLKISAVAAN